MQNNVTSTLGHDKSGRKIKRDDFYVATDVEKKRNISLSSRCHAVAIEFETSESYRTFDC